MKEKPDIYGQNHLPDDMIWENRWSSFGKSSKKFCILGPKCPKRKFLLRRRFCDKSPYVDNASFNRQQLSKKCLLSRHFPLRRRHYTANFLQICVYHNRYNSRQLCFSGLTEEKSLETTWSLCRKIINMSHGNFRAKSSLSNNHLCFPTSC